VSEPATEHDAVTDLPGAPPEPEPPVTVTAPWHNAPGTGAYAEPEVTTVRAYDKPTEDGPVVAKVLTPPARPRAIRGRRAATPKAAAGEESEAGEAGEDADGEAD
jgi:hypothetical protein